MEDTSIQAAGVELDALVHVPDGSRGVVVFAHGSGSSRHSTRNQRVAEILWGYGLATVLMDLLTSAEDAWDQRTREHRFNIPMLGDRVTGAVDWLGAHADLDALPIGLFGASTGAAAALLAAAVRPDRVSAVVSRGGRPDLAEDALGKVTVPVLLLVGERDDVVIDLNRQAAEQLSGPHDLILVPGAGHLFEEPGALEEVARRAADWFTEHLATPPPAGW